MGAGSEIVGPGRRCKLARLIQGVQGQLGLAWRKDGVEALLLKSLLHRPNVGTETQCEQHVRERVPRTHSGPSKNQLAVPVQSEPGSNEQLLDHGLKVSGTAELRNVIEATQVVEKFSHGCRGDAQAVHQCTDNPVIWLRACQGLPHDLIICGSDIKEDEASR